MERADKPIGIFDSGIGGLSVLRHIRTALPEENLHYFADSGFAPYGEKPEDVVINRTRQIADYLFEYDCKALVIACNTATAAAVHILREAYPDIPIVGIEPGLKPAAMATQSRKVGVLATERTLASLKFRKLHQQLSEATGVQFLMQACPGLAELVEKNELGSSKTADLVRQYTLPLLEKEADTLVLGCTHYPFLQTIIEETVADFARRTVSIIDTGTAVTKQLMRLLEQHGLKQVAMTEASGVHAETTGDPRLLAALFAQLLNMRPDVTAAPLTRFANGKHVLPSNSYHKGT